MNNQKRVQHKPQRDTSNRENANLKQEIKQLKKKIKRLERDVEKGLPALEEQIMAEKLEIETEIENTNQFLNNCPNCNNSGLFIYTTPAGRKIQGCKSCKKYRKELS